MNRSSQEGMLAERSFPKHVDHNDTSIRQPRYLLVSWILLLLLGVLFVLASIFDLVSDARIGLPSDHMAAFQAMPGMSWTSARLASLSITHFVTLLEVAYAVHELVFGLLFLLLVAIPFRRRAR